MSGMEYGRWNGWGFLDAGELGRQCPRRRGGTMGEDRKDGVCGTPVGQDVDGQVHDSAGGQGQTSFYEAARETWIERARKARVGSSERKRHEMVEDDRWPRKGNGPKTGSVQGFQRVLKRLAGHLQDAYWALQGATGR